MIDKLCYFDDGVSLSALPLTMHLISLFWSVSSSPTLSLYSVHVHSAHASVF